MSFNSAFGNRPSPFTNPGLIESSHILDGFRQASANVKPLLFDSITIPPASPTPNHDTFVSTTGINTAPTQSTSLSQPNKQHLAPAFAALSPHHSVNDGSDWADGFSTIAPNALKAIWQGAQLLMARNSNDAFDAWRDASGNDDLAQSPINLSA
jgi:hypothetical protein